MDEILRFVKAHKRQILKYGKKLFYAFKKKQGQAGQGGGSYAGAAGAGMAAGGAAAYGGQQYHQQQQQPMMQQQPYNGQQGGHYDSPPPQGQYGRPTTVSPQQMPSGIKPHHGRYNDNEVNQKNEHYKQLRAQAHSEGDKMAKCFDDSHKAFAQGDGGRAKQLSNEGHEHKRKMEQANQEAADWIYHANNEDSGPNEVDLHGLYTQEAITKTEEAIRMHQQRGTPELRIIVGKGIHSKDHVAHIKPAIEKLMNDYRLSANIDPTNAGVLLVHLQGGANVPQGAYRDAGFTNQLAKQTTGDDENCIIM